MNKLWDDFKEKARNVSFWIELFALIGLGIYTTFAVFQWSANKKAADAAKSAADTAANTVNKNVEQFRIDERAWIEIESVIPETPKISRGFIYDVFTKNVGKTVARDIELKRLTSLDANQGDILARDIQTAQDKLLKDQPGEPSPVPSLPMPKSLAPNTAVYTPFTLGGTAPKDRFFDYLIGRIDYNDAFGIAHWIKFCFVITDSNGTLGICQAGNDEDRNPEVSEETLAAVQGGTPMIPAWHWILNHVDRILSFIAIVIAVIAMLDVRHLFRTTEERARTAILRELNNYGASMSAFYRACQYLEFTPGELDREGAALLFATFRIQQLLAPKSTKEELSELRKSTRKDVDEAARGYVELLISSGIGRLKEGYTLPATK